ncbi:MAG: glycosyl hydrolase 115 family protein [Prevotellaceae bacterium]|nr:glycosyl hydrolase 115 family protein [Prevotellaceae bacterium]
MKKKLLVFILSLLSTSAVWATEDFVSFKKGAGMIPLTGTSDTIVYDKAEWKGVIMAVNNLRHDLKAVTGSECAPITVATVGKSAIAKKYAKYTKQLKGKWEQYIIAPREAGGLLILGSDKRGTIYGIYELSRQLGVSPWYWMADAPIAKHDEVWVKPGVYTDGEPKVKYRGIFINDEWPSFGTWCNKQFGGVNSKAYSKIFELLLRMKANYFWPAMWASAFNEDDPLNPKVADEMGIVMGTSHHEPMMRAHKEYTKRREEVGAWDYAKNPAGIEKFFTDGIENSKNYENIITIGMRGDGDVAMGTGNDADNMKTLKNVIDAQRRIISNVHKKKASEVPQLWAIFTEVQRYYDAGFTVPDDVTLLFCDNNWGYIRRMGGEREKGKKGGMGMYYHIDMNGGPWNDRWVNTTTIPKLREQFNLAYKSGIDRIWIINVGDLKPKEVPINFIMDYAWNPDAIQPGDEKAWLEGFTRSIFGEEYAAETADIIAKYSKYNLWRKAEAQYPGIFNNDEMLMTNAMWQSLVVRCENLKAKLPKEMQDAFYQLVYYPAVGSAGVAQIYNYATMGDSLAIEALMDKDRRLTEHYNKGIANGKWNGMMLDNHIGYTKWSIPDKNYNPMTLGFKVEHDLSSKETSEYSIPAYKYTNKVDGKDAKWIFLPDLGRGEGCMGSDNVVAASDLSGNGAALEYDIDLKTDMVAIGILPTQDIRPERGLRLGVQIDNQPMKILDARQGIVDTFGEYTPQNLAVSKVLKPLPAPNGLLLSGWYKGKRLPRRDEVFDNLRWLNVPLNVSPGKHTLRIVMIDPEIVVEQIVVNPDNNHYSYFGAKEK